jgi:hypothetical protein
MPSGIDEVVMRTRLSYYHIINIFCFFYYLESDLYFFLLTERRLILLLTEQVLRESAELL